MFAPRLFLPGTRHFLGTTIMIQATTVDKKWIAVDRIGQLRRGQILVMNDDLLDFIEENHADEVAELHVVSAVNGNQCGLLDSLVVWSKAECPGGPKHQERHSDSDLLVVFLHTPASISTRVSSRSR